MGGRKKNGRWRREESPTDHSRQGGFGRGMRIATGAERPRNDRSRKNLRVIPRPVRRLVVGIRNTPAQRSRRTDCHSQCAHWLRNDTVNKRCGARQAGDRKGRPYESVTGGAMGGRPQGSPLRSAARNVWAGYRPLRKFFDREGMVCFGFWWRRMTRAPGC